MSMIAYDFTVISGSLVEKEWVNHASFAIFTTSKHFIVRKLSHLQQSVLEAFNFTKYLSFQVEDASPFSNFTLVEDLT